MTAVIAICVAFLLGSIPTGIVATLGLTGRDVRKAGSGNFGAANVARAVGLKIGILVAVLDMLKGAVPVLLGMWLGLDSTALAIVALIAVVGHDFSVFLRFRGGKGVATTLGVAIVLAPLATLLAMLVWLVTMLIWRYSSLASLLSLALLPLVAFLTGRPQAYVVVLIALFLLGAVKHWENIFRLVQGKESKFIRTRPASGN